MNELKFIFLVFAVWCVSYMLVNQDGPYNIFERLREYKRLTRLLDCIRCTSVWVSAVICAVYFVRLLPGVDIVYGVIIWLAVSAGACLFDNVMYSLEASGG